MYKSLKRIVLLLALVCVTLGLSAFALACNPKPDDNNGPEISAEYQALYEQYKEAAGENAKTLQDWYDALSADIEEIGDIGDITDMDVLEIENVKYVALTYENGRLFLEELLNGESFKEYSVFTLSPNNAADESTITGIYLDVNRKGANGALEKVRTARTGADGKVSVYLEADSQATYVITVGEQSAEAYGFALGYEPEFSGSQETKTVAFNVQTASQKVTYAAKVVYRAENYAGTKDVKLSLRYVESDAASLKVVGEGTTGDDGKLEISFYAHENSKYEFVLDETSLTPDKYEPVEGPIEVDPEADETVFTLIRLKNYGAPDVLTPSGTPKEDLEDPEDKDWEALTIPTDGEVSELLEYHAQDDTYYYMNSADSANNNKQVYIAMDFFLARVHAEKTIKQLLDGGNFKYESLIDADQNTWAERDYSQVLEKYMEYVTESGVYPLNKDLYSFIEAAARGGLFAEKTTDGKYDMFMPLVVESATKLIVGTEYTAVISTVTTTYHWGASMPYISIPIKSNVPEGWYKLSVNSSQFPSGSTTVNQGKYARLGGYTKDRTGDFYLGRNFTLTRTSTASATTNVNFEGVIYVGAGAKEIVLFNSACQSQTKAYNYNLTLTLSNITAEDGTVASADVSALAGKKQEILSADKSEYDVLVYPESMLEEHVTNRTDATYLKNYTNISTYGYTFYVNRMFLKYTITPTVGEIEGLKIHQYRISNPKVNSAISGSNKGMPQVSYTAGVELEGDTFEFTAGTNAGAYSDGVMFTHTGEGILTMKIKMEKPEKTRYTVTYSAGEGVGEDYIEGSGSWYYSTSYYAPDANITMLDNTNTNLGYTREGYLFSGWSYEDAEGTSHTVKAGEQVPMLDHDMVFTAVWREVSVNSSEDLAAGEEIEVEFDSGTYTSVEINLADTVVENKGYTLTISTGANEWGWNLIFGDYTIYPFETESSETTHTYVAYFVKVGEADKLVVDILKSDVNFKATIALEEYTPVVLKADGSEIIVPLYDSDLVKPRDVAAEDVKTNVLYAVLDQSLDAATYSFTKVKLAPSRCSGIYLTGDLTGEDSGAKYLESVNLATFSNAKVVLSEGVSKIHFGESMHNNKYFGAIKLKIERLYTVTYKSSAEDIEQYKVFEHPAQDTKYYNSGATVTIQDAGDTQTVQFMHWVKEGDDTKHQYYAQDTFQITEDVTFVAVWRLLNPMEKSDNFTDMATPVEFDGVTIDADTYTSFKITVGKVMDAMSFGLRVSFDLGTSNFNGEIPLVSGSTKFVLTHSDALSSADHNVFTGFYRHSKDDLTLGSTCSFTLDLNAWKAANNPKIENIKVKVEQGSVKVGNNYGSGVYLEEKQGKLQAVGSINPNSTSDKMFSYNLPNTILSGHTYKVHVKFDVADQTSVTGLTLVDYSRAADGMQYKGGEDKPMTYNEGDKEYTYEGWSTDTRYRYFALKTTSTVYYSCTVWLEQTDTVKNALSLDNELTGIKVAKNASTIVYLDDSILAAEKYNTTEHKYSLTVTGATSAGVQVEYYDDITNNRGIQNKIFTETTTTFVNLSFGHIKLTLTSKDTAVDEQTVSLKLTEYIVFNLNTGDNEFSLGADKAETNLTNVARGGQNRDYFRVTMTKKDGGNLPDTAVIKLTGGAGTYTFNKENNFSVECACLNGTTGKIWAEDGAAVEVKVNLERWPYIIWNPGASGSQTVSIDLNDNNESVEILLPVVNQIKAGSSYKVYFMFPSLVDLELEIAYSGKTVAATRSSSTSKTYSTAEPVTMPAEEEYLILKVTAKSGVTAPISGIKVYITAA